MSNGVATHVMELGIPSRAMHLIGIVWPVRVFRVKRRLRLPEAAFLFSDLTLADPSVQVIKKLRKTLNQGIKNSAHRVVAAKMSILS